MKKAMTILYKVGSNLYINLTNRCPCACTFCIRNEGDCVYEETESLWLEREPTFEEVKTELQKQNLSLYNEIVFCGYGEPTCALDVLLQTAAFIKENYNIPLRINTNGLGNLINGKDICSLLVNIDTVSISLNSSAPAIYEQRVRPKYGSSAYKAMLDFAKECKNFVPNVVMSTVRTTITKEDEEECAKLCASLGVSYRIRELA